MAENSQDFMTFSISRKKTTNFAKYRKNTKIHFLFFLCGRFYLQKCSYFTFYRKSRTIKSNFTKIFNFEKLNGIYLEDMSKSKSLHTFPIDQSGETMKYIKVHILSITPDLFQLFQILLPCVQWQICSRFPTCL